MNVESLAWAAAGVLVVFWVVGAYNRLMTLRNRISDHWRQIDTVLRRRHYAACALVQAVREPLRPEQGTLEALTLSLGVLSAACDNVRPLSHPGAGGVGAALTPLGSQLARLQSLIELQPALAGDPDLAPHRAVLDEADARLPGLRQAFNEAAAQYNADRRLWPTRLVAIVFSLGEVAPL